MLVSVSCALVTLAGLVSQVVVADPVDAAVSDPLRVLILGDSVTQGSAGDWTWRYRLWKHFAAQGVDVDFVGPRTDLADNVSGSLGSDAYVDPDFDRDHAARWGMTLAFPDAPIGTLVEEYQPDVVIEMLGINDLTWLGRSAEDVSASVAQFVADARSGKPDIAVVLSRQVQTWSPGVPAFNDLLSSLGNSLSTPESPVVVSTPDSGFDLHADTWDTSHPNAQGELIIAAAQADALHALGIVPAYPRPLPSLPLGPRAPASLQGWVESGAVRLAWTSPPGADHEFVWVRDLTPGHESGWLRQAQPEYGTNTWYTHVADGHSYQFALESAKGFAVASDVRSNAVTLSMPGVAAPRITAARVRRDGRAVLSWAGQAGADHVVARRDPSQAGGWRVVARTTGLGVVLKPDKPGAIRTYRVVAWTGGVASGPSNTVRLTVPMPRPVPWVRAVSPASDRARVRWGGVPEATSYRVHVASSPSCKRRTQPFGFRVALASRRVVLRTPDRAMWVRVRSVRLGVSSAVSSSSTTCTRVR